MRLVPLAFLLLLACGPASPSAPSFDLAALTPVHVGAFNAQLTSYGTAFQVYPHDALHATVVTGNTLPAGLQVWYHWDDLNSVPCDVLGSPYPDPTVYFCGAISSYVGQSLTVDSLTGAGYVYDASANDVPTTITFGAVQGQSGSRRKPKHS